MEQDANSSSRKHDKGPFTTFCLSSDWGVWEAGNTEAADEIMTFDGEVNNDN